jgi:para-nitrobenzyl esterase
MSEGDETPATVETAPNAMTTAGAIRGYAEKGISVFKGIPYGADTGGANRWRAPAKPAAWSGVRDTTAFGPMCPQVFGAPMPEETAVLQTGPMSEDCLSLNVWTPATGAESGKRPVMVWFHGGGFSIGSGGTATNDGVNLCAKNDVVLVTINHRLNLFGFLHLAGVAEAGSDLVANAGMLDCIAALEWVRDNIAGFGGDPGNVTIFGQSGGGMKVTTLMAMPAAKGLFHRVIAQSGFAVSAASLEQATAITRDVLSSLGAEGASLDALRAMPAENLVSLLETRPDLVFGLGPVVDGDALPGGPFSPSAPTQSADVPMMLGTTETEIVFLSFAPLDPIDDDELHAQLMRYTTLGDEDLTSLIAAYRAEYPGHDNTYLYHVLGSDWLLGADGVTVAERQAAQGGAPVYAYYFTKHTPVRGGKLRSPHTLDIPYVFDTLERGAPIIGPASEEDQRLADRLSRTWATFARTGDPNNPDMPAWAPYDAANRHVMVLDDAPVAILDPHPETRVLMAKMKAKISQTLASLATGD